MSAPTFLVQQGDCLEVLRTLKDGAAQTCVTSPPYWGRRSYVPDGHPLKPLELGLEATPAEYVARMVGVFREVRRVLADDGTLWLNLGASFAGAGGGEQGQSGQCADRSVARQGARVKTWRAGTIPGRVGQRGGSRNRDGVGGVRGLKPKDLVGIPWLVAFALQADGWWLRSDIIWAKPNPMPESVQGSHYSRHMVTIEEYEDLSGLRYAGERAGNEWAGNMPRVSEREVSSRKAPLSAKREGRRNGTRQGDAGGRSGEAQEIQPIAARGAEQGQVRSDPEGKSHAGKGTGKIPGQSARNGGEREEAPTDTGRATQENSASRGECEVPQDREREGAGASPERKEERGRGIDDKSADGEGMVGGPVGEQGPLLLLQEETEVDAGPRNPAEQGRAARVLECGPGVRTVQLTEAGSDNSALLVGCPGCRKCLPHHGYLFHLSAGRPTRAHEYLFLLTKAERYYYDAAAIAEKSTGEGHGPSPKLEAAARVTPGSGLNGGLSHGWEPSSATRNRRSVWTISPKPFAEAHFAVMPEGLVLPCVLAGSRPGDTVLDPFAGSGTVGVVAVGQGRSFVGAELNPAYVEMARRRIGSSSPLFAQEAVSL